MADLQRAARAVAEEGLGAWLFLNQFHKDPIADRILGIPVERHNTRPWLYLLPARGGPVKLVHAIEAGLLDHLPGERRVYGSREQFVTALRELASSLSQPGAAMVGCDFSAELPAGAIEGLLFLVVGAFPGGIGVPALQHGAHAVAESHEGPPGRGRPHDDGAGSCSPHPRGHRRRGPASRG